jgi:hypothetical protein
MRNKIVISVLGIVISMAAHGQKIPAKQLNAFFHYASVRVSQGMPDHSAFKRSMQNLEIHSGTNQVIKKLHLHPPPVPVNANNGNDTLVVGLPPYDSLVITGDYTHIGPVIVIGNGILRFNHAMATIIGDMWVFGENALVTADSSTLYFPQEYFYQRSLIVTMKGRVQYNHTTLDYSGLSHNLFISDSATVTMHHVKDIGFTTCGLSGKPRVDIENSDEPSEYVITDKAQLTFKNDKTLLLWHHVPDSGVMNFTFPPGDSLISYHFSKNVPGISGIEYQIDVDSCSDVMWALMPARGSDISISDSKIRSVGLWFNGHDSIHVNGLVDNSEYSSFTANLPDRNLHFESTNVQTWSLYPMDTVVLNVTGCILGEIGTENRSQLISNDIYVDGSGGYWWTTDRTFMVGGFSSAVNAIRSNNQSIFVFAYSTLNNGVASSMGNSILMLIQSELPSDPKLYDGSCIWNAYVGEATNPFVDTIVHMNGSAWIDKTATSKLMGLAWFRLYYQRPADTSWIAVSDKITVGKHNDLLSDWNTHGLKPGAYLIKLVLCDNTADSNKVEAMKSVNLLPKILGVRESDESGLRVAISPNPVNKTSILTIESPKNATFSLMIVDLSGKILDNTIISISAGKNIIPIGDLKVSPGVYCCILESGGYRKIVNFISK